jgi:hypothetical protein
MSLNLEAVEGKSHHPERFGFILRLWSLLLRRQEHNGSAHWCGCLGGWGCVFVCGGGGVAVSWVRVGRSCNSD